MPEQGPKQLLYDLLNAAFSSDEIQTMAFDLFPSVYEDSSALTKREMIQHIVSHAVSQGKTQDILVYVREHNPYQYERFSGQDMLPGSEL